MFFVLVEKKKEKKKKENDLEMCAPLSSNNGALMGDFYSLSAPITIMNMHNHAHNNGAHNVHIMIILAVDIDVIVDIVDIESLASIWRLRLRQS
jgi:hypothetical protein